MGTRVNEEKLVKALAAVYAVSIPNAVAIGRLCDDHLDRSGRLLGVVRERVRAGSAAASSKPRKS